MPINAMLSSTVADLVPDREAVAAGLRSTGVVDIVGVAPGVAPSTNSSPYLATIDMARRCELYVLILGRRYGFEAIPGQSATEAEYLAAYKEDPTKVIVLRKTVARVDIRQQKFVDLVTDYHKGYFVNSYINPRDAGVLARTAFEQWLVERAAIGRGLNYFDHFIRLVVQRQPFPGVSAEYRVTATTIELTYRLPGKVRSLHFEKSAIYSDFWGNLAQVERTFESWRVS